jgi:hypothetical protein
MTRVPTIALFFFTWLAVFGQTQFPVVTDWLAVPLTVLPALMVYTALTHGIFTVAILAVGAGLGVDSLSANPLGVSILPLFAVGFALQLRQHLILRDQTYAQFWLGLAAGLAVPIFTWVLLHLDSRPPIAGPFLIWQLFLIGIVNAGVCPALFKLFDTLRETFDYQPMTEGSFRPDREIKRGRI